MPGDCPTAFGCQRRRPGKRREPAFRSSSKTAFPDPDPGQCPLAVAAAHRGDCSRGQLVRPAKHRLPQSPERAARPVDILAAACCGPDGRQPCRDGPVRCLLPARLEGADPGSLVDRDAGFRLEQFSDTGAARRSRHSLLAVPSDGRRIRHAPPGDCFHFNRVWCGTRVMAGGEPLAAARNRAGALRGQGGHRICACRRR